MDGDVGWPRRQCCAEGIALLGAQTARTLPRTVAAAVREPERGAGDMALPLCTTPVTPTMDKKQRM